MGSGRGFISLGGILVGIVAILVFIGAPPAVIFLLGILGIIFFGIGFAMSRRR
jgi:hypothetical protein